MRVENVKHAKVELFILFKFVSFIKTLGKHHLLPRKTSSFTSENIIFS